MIQSVIVLTRASVRVLNTMRPFLWYGFDKMGLHLHLPVENVQIKFGICLVKWKIIVEYSRLLYLQIVDCSKSNVFLITSAWYRMTALVVGKIDIMTYFSA